MKPRPLERNGKVKTYLLSFTAGPEYVILKANDEKDLAAQIAARMKANPSSVTIKPLKTYKVEAVHHKRTLIYKEFATDAIEAMRQLLRRRRHVLVVGATELSDTYHKDKWGNWTNVVEGSFVGGSRLIDENKKS